MAPVSPGSLSRKPSMSQGVKAKDHYNLEELLACGRGEMFGPGNAQLPAPPMLLFDRIITINDDVPLANSDVNAITEDAPVNTATGNVIACQQR